MGLVFKPRLKIFKNYNGDNTFDGKKAYSYQWYQYAQIMPDGTCIMVEKAYSPTTGSHMRSLLGLLNLDWDAIKYINAPRGLNNPSTAREAIEAEIAKLELELTNKRNRNIEQRKLRIIVLQEQLVTLAELEKVLDAQWFEESNKVA